ncbi:MAG TPA: EamA family transporter [Rhizobacter sp.]
MSAAALALVLVAALLHAVWNVVVKKVGGDGRFALLVACFIVVVWAPVGVWVGWDAVPRWGWAEWALIVASGVVHLLYFHVLLRGYAASDLTVVYPVARGSAPLVASLGAVLLMGETLSGVGMLGVLAVTGGVFLIAGGPGLWARAHDPAQRARVRAGVGWGAGTGLLISGYTLIDGYAVKVWLISPVLIDYFGNLARIPFMLPGALRNPDALMTAWRTQWKHALFVAIVSPLAYVLVLYAVKLAPLSHVAPAREVSMLFAALLGGKLLGEGDRGLRVVGAACIALGVAGLALG